MRELPRIGGEVGNYRLESLVSRGGMAVVYLAEDLRLGRKVALKLLAVELAEDDRFRERFLRESRVVASIDHPNVVPIFDAGEVDGLLYIAMRYVEDPDLRRLLRTEGQLGIDRAVALATQVAGALGAAHTRGLVHRDVKPANVLLIHRNSPRAADHVYLSDFGIAKHATSVSGLTATGQLVGTLSYVAPEQIEDRAVDGRTDIYSLGCVLFECLAGRPAFKKQEDVAVLLAHINEEAPRVTSWRPDCPTALADVIARTLEKSPDDRFQTCGDLIEALRNLDVGAPEVTVTRTSVPATGDLPKPAPPDDGPPSGSGPRPEPEPGPEPDPEPAPEPPSRRSAPSVPLLAAVGAALAALTVALVLLLGGGDGDDDSGAQRAATTVGPAPDTRTGGPPNVEDRWRLVRPSPLARQQVGAAAVGARVCVVGGLTGTGTAATATDLVEAYDPAIDNWTQTTKFPHAIHHPMAVSYRDRFVVIGGFIPEGRNLTAKVSAEVWELRGTTWRRLPPLKHARAAGAAAVVDGKIVVVGGQGNGELVTDTEIFDGKAWRAGAPMPTPREHLAAAASRRFFYAVGGRELSADTNTGALERYDARSDTWKKLQSMPTPSGSLGAAVVNGQLVAVGGEAPADIIAAVQSYNLTNQEWSQLAPLPTARHGLGVVAVGPTLFAVGGAKAPGHAASTNETDALDFGDA